MTPQHIGRQRFPLGLLLLPCLLLGCENGTGSDTSQPSATGSAGSDAPPPSTADEASAGSSEPSPTTPFPPAGVFLATLVAKDEPQASVSYRLRFEGSAELVHVEAQLRERGKIVYRHEQDRRILVPEWTIQNDLFQCWSNCGLSLNIDTHDDDQGRLDTLVGMNVVPAEGGRRCEVFNTHRLDLERMLAATGHQVAASMKEMVGDDAAAERIGEEVVAESRRQVGGNAGVMVSGKGLIPLEEVGAGAARAGVWRDSVEVAGDQARKGVMLGAILFDEPEESRSLPFEERVSQAPKSLVLLVRLSGETPPPASEGK